MISKVTNVKIALLVIFVSILNITVYNTCSVSSHYSQLLTKYVV